METKCCIIIFSCKCCKTITTQLLTTTFVEWEPSLKKQLCQSLLSKIHEKKKTRLAYYPGNKGQYKEILLQFWNRDIHW